LPERPSAIAWKNLALASIATGEAFPEVVRDLRSMLVPVDHPAVLIHSLANSSHPDIHPHESLELLSYTISPDQVIDFPGLRILLDRLRGADVRLANETDFKVFETAVRRFEAARAAR
jgi:hypothetical protein